MNETQIAEALTSGMLGPCIGALLVVLALTASKFRSGTPLGDQLKAMWPTMKGGLIAGVLAGGTTLAAGRPWTEATSAGMVVLFALTNLRAAPPPPPAEPPVAG